MLNTQPNCKNDEDNRENFQKILLEKGKIFTDSNYCELPDINKYTYSKLKDVYYKLEGHNLRVYQDTISLTKSAIYPNLSVKKVSEDIGYGVFVNSYVKKNTLLMRYS